MDTKWNSATTGSITPNTCTPKGKAVQIDTCGFYNFTVKLLFTNFSLLYVKTNKTKKHITYI